MSRVNKYRAWNTEKKIMCYDNEDLSACYWDGAYSSEVGIINEYLNLPEHLRDYEYMQYIGVSDKNGKEIYEGDIVRTNQYGVDDGAGHNYAGFDTFVVEFSDCSFCLKNKWRRFNLRPSCTLEVIGNVYENADLLKE